MNLSSSKKPMMAAFDQGAVPKIAVLNLATVDLGVGWKPLVDGLQKFVTDYFSPHWGQPAVLYPVTGMAIPPGYWGLVFSDNTTEADANGLHDLTPDGYPLAHVFAKTAHDDGDVISAVASHELAEMLVDPAASDGTYHILEKRLYAKEVCFVEGTPVQTPSGPRPVEVIGPGDEVIDKDGMTAVVSRAWCEGIPLRVLEFRVNGGKRFRVTPNHTFPVWAWPRSCACGCGKEILAGRAYAVGHSRRGRRRGERRLIGTTAKVTIGRNQSGGLPAGYTPVRRMRADEIRPGDFLMVPRRFTPVAPSVPLPFARLLGYYVAEGNVRPDGQVRLCFSGPEWDTWVPDVEGLAHAVWPGWRGRDARSVGLVKKYLQREGRLSTVDVAAGGAVCVSLGGSGAASKRLAPEVMGWPLLYKEELVRGMFRGDGYRDMSGVVSYSVQYVTVSEFLASQVELVLAQLGFPSSTSVTEEHVEADGYLRARKYKVTVRGRFAASLAHMVWGDVTPPASTRKSCSHDWVDEDFVYRMVRAVSIHDNRDRVYNITVGGSHSYTACNLGTYNCDPVHTSRIEVDGIQFCSFVFPAWYEAFRKPGSDRFDYLGECTRPFQVLKGGYIPVLEHGVWSYRFGSRRAEKSFNPGLHPRLGWRKTWRGKKSKPRKAPAHSG